MKETLWHVTLFAIGILAATCVFWVIQRKKGQPFPWWASIVIEASIGVIAGFVAYHVTHEGEETKKEELFREIGTFLIHTLFVMIVLELGRSARKLEKAERDIQDAISDVKTITQARLDTIDRTVATSISGLAASHAELARIIDNDQRIILARSEPLERSKEIAVLGVERLDHGELPAPLRPPDDGEPSDNNQWEETISLLRFDRLQDLLFSTDYLRHFFKLSQATKKQYRLLIVNDTPRSEVAIHSFLEMSDRLGIPTYVHLKSHFHAMLHTLDTLLPARDASEVNLILQGQPELSILVDGKQNGLKEDNYLLRFRIDKGKGPVRSYGRNQGQHKTLTRIGIVHKLLLLGIRDDERRGLAHLAAVLRDNRTDPWNKDSLERELKP